MKNSLFLLFILLFSAAVFAQSQPKPKITITSNTLNILYIGVDNTIHIEKDGICSGMLSLWGSGCGLSVKGGSLDRIVRVERVGKVRIVIGGGNDVKPTVFEFQTKRLPRKKRGAH
jgi:GldM C-terminal domain